MLPTLTLIASVIGFITVVLGLIRAIIEFRTMRMKLAPISAATEAVTTQSQKTSGPKVSHSPEVLELRKSIDRTWTRVSMGAALAGFSFLISFVILGHPQTQGPWWTAAAILMDSCGVVYVFLAMLAGRRAVGLHEAKARLEIIEIVPALLKHYREHLRSRAGNGDPPPPTAS